MNKLLLASTALLTLAAAGTASAQDWTGFHGGLNMGLAGNEFAYPFEASISTTAVDGEADLTSSGFVGGAQFGYDRQLSNKWVVGVEADLNASDVEGRVSVGGDAAGGVTGELEADVGSEVDYFGTLRGRLGYAYSADLMPYVTAGWAYGDVNSEYNVAVTSGGAPVFAASDSLSSNQDGWTVGAGLEYRLSDSLTFKTEYLYVDLGSYNLIDISGGGDFATVDVDTKFHVARVGVNYRF